MNVSPRRPRVGRRPTHPLKEARRARDRFREAAEEAGGRVLVTIVEGGFGVLVRIPASADFDPRLDCDGVECPVFFSLIIPAAEAIAC